MEADNKNNEKVMSTVGFNTTFEEVQKYEWQSVFEMSRSSFHLRDLCFRAFYAKASTFREAGDVVGERVFAFLGAVTSLLPNFDSTETPFSPYSQNSTHRSATLEDFNESDALVIAKLATAAIKPELKARLADVASVLKFDHGLVRVAAYAYLDTARLYENRENWVVFVGDIERSAQLALRLGRMKEPFLDVMRYIEELLIKFSIDETGLCCSRLLEIFQKYRYGDPKENAKTSEAIAERAEKDNLSPFSLQYWELAAEWHRRAGELDAHKRCAIRAAETHVLDAEAAIKRAPPSYMASSDHLSHAVESLRRANAPKERIEEVHRMLLEHQKHVHKEMGSFGPEIDITDLQEKAKNHVKGFSFPDSILRMIAGIDIIDVQAHRNYVLKMAGDNPLYAIIGSSRVEFDGRIVGHRPSMLTGDPEQYEAAVWTEMIHQAAMLHLPSRIATFIDPCRMQIWEEHRPRMRDLSFIVENQPLIPPGHEHSFARGFHAGFEGDWHAASYFLVPQVENSIRYLLNSHGAITSKLDDKLIQEVRSLDQLLSMPETTELFGDGHVFELRCILTEEFGSNLRNRLAHGLMTDGDCYAPAVQSLWWLLLRLCVIPLIKGSTEESPDDFSESSHE